MVVVDFMHEWELGVWKALLIHLIHLLMAPNVAKVHQLDFRFVWSHPIFNSVILMVSQISEHPSFWERHYSEISFQCFKLNETCCSWLWRYSSGNKPYVMKWDIELKVFDSVLFQHFKVSFWLLTMKPSSLFCLWHAGCIHFPSLKCILKSCS